jgi:hypothetical protein
LQVSGELRLFNSGIEVEGAARCFQAPASLQQDDDLDNAPAQFPFVAKEIQTLAGGGVDEASRHLFGGSTGAHDTGDGAEDCSGELLRIPRVCL